MSFAKGFAAVLVDQYNKGTEIDHEKQKVDMTEKLRIAEEQRTRYQKQKDQEQEWDTTATSLNESLGLPPEAKPYLLSLVKGGASSQYILEKYNSGELEIIPPSKNKSTVVSDNPDIKSKSVGPAAVTPEDVAVPDAVKNVNVPLPEQRPDEAVDAARTPAAVTGDTKTEPATTSSRVETKNTEETPDPVSDELKKEGEKVGIVWKTPSQKIDVDSLDDETVRLRIMENDPKKYDKAQIANQRLIVDTINSNRAKQLADEAAAKGEDLRPQARIYTDPVTGEEVIRSIDNFKVNDEGTPVDSSGKPIALGENEKFVSTDEKALDRLASINEKTLAGVTKYNEKLSATSTSVDLGRRMTDILANPANKNINTVAPEITNVMMKVKANIAGVQDFIDNQYAAAKGDPKGTMTAETGQQLMQAAQEAERQALSMLNPSDENQRLAIQKVIYENYQIAFAYQMALANSQSGRDVSNAEFDRFLQMAGKTSMDPTKAAENISLMLQQQVQVIDNERKMLKTSVKNLSNGVLPGQANIQILRIGDMWDSTHANTKYFNDIQNKRTFKEDNTKQQLTQQPSEKIIPGTDGDTRPSKKTGTIWKRENGRWVDTKEPIQGEQ